MMYWIIGIFILIGIIADCAIRLKKKDKDQTDNQEQDKEKSIDLSPYKRSYLLTKREYAFFKALKPITDKLNLHILAKVRLEDIVTVESNLPYKEKNIARNRVKSRHLDFVLVDPDTFYVKLAIELDDNSHDNKEAQQKDEFKNRILEKIGLPLIRTRDTSDIENRIKEALQIK
ncbi:MAG: DUF2726 domain-containing protein [Huintestinicola sp.]